MTSVTAPIMYCDDLTDPNATSRRIGSITVQLDEVPGRDGFERGLNEEVPRAVIRAAQRNLRGNVWVGEPDG